MGLCAATKEKSQSTKATVLDCQQLIMVQGNPAMEFPPCTLHNAPQLVCFSCQRIAASTLHLHLPSLVSANMLPPLGMPFCVLINLIFLGNLPVT